MGVSYKKHQWEEGRRLEVEIFQQFEGGYSRDLHFAPTISILKARISISVALDSGLGLFDDEGWSLRAADGGEDIGTLLC